ncbi:class I SAM-dependent methyltransferase [Candidatus Dojkabacteria bacterium]|nr:class I SAM-dependent methyltransferase [Candidatus Dojkabacteria bacterium]
MGDLLPTKKAFVHKDPKAILDYWEQQFSTSYKIGKISSENQKILKTLVKNVSKGKMLDNGCGEGRIKQFFEKLGWEVYGSDISSNAIKKASEITPVNLVCAPCENLPFRDKFFDAQISWRVLHSIPKPKRKKAVKEMARVLKKNSLLFCSVQTADDKETISKYRKHGIELNYDRLSFVADIMVEGRKVQRLKHFYTKKDIFQEIESGGLFQVEKILLYKEKCGWSNKKQTYWIVTAKKF